MKKLFYVWCLVLGLFIPPSSAAWAEGPGLDARDLAMGGMAFADGAPPSAVFLNPALVAQADSLRTCFTQTRLSVDQFDFQVSASFPLVRGLALGLGWDALEVQNQVEYGIVRDSNGQVEVNPANGQPLTQVLGFFTQSENRFYASAAAALGFLSLGASLKYDLVDFGSTEGSGFSADLGAVLRLADPLRLGLVLQDPGDEKVSFADGTPGRREPCRWGASVAWRFARWGPVDFTLEPGLRRDLWDGDDTHWGGGLEASWSDDVFLRVGDDNGDASFGVGLVAHPGKVFPEIRVDYAYLNRAADGYPSRLTLTTAW